MGAKDVAWTIDTSGISQNDTIFMPGNTLRILEWNQVASSSRDTTFSVGFKRPGVYTIIIEYDSAGIHLEDEFSIYVSPDAAYMTNLEPEPGSNNPVRTTFPDSAIIRDNTSPVDTLYLVLRDRYGNFISEDKIVSIESTQPTLVLKTPVAPDSTSLEFTRGGYGYTPGGIFSDIVIVTGESGLKDTFYIDLESFMDGAAIYDSSGSNINNPLDSITIKATDSITLHSRGYFELSPGNLSEYGLVNADWELLEDSRVRVPRCEGGHQSVEADSEADGRDVQLRVGSGADCGFAA